MLRNKSVKVLIHYISVSQFPLESKIFSELLITGAVLLLSSPGFFQPNLVFISRELVAFLVISFCF